MRRLRLVVEYDGTPFVGFQRQSADQRESVQGELERKLSQLLAHPITILGAGRTDTGVHATGQVVTFDTDSERSLVDLVRGANALLRPQVRVHSADQVGFDFHPRFTALSRTYHYYLRPQARADALFGHRYWALPETLDLEAMRRAAAPLVGSHDFSAYCRGVGPEEPRRRNLFRLDLTPLPWGLVRLEVEGNAFLRRMVRMLVGNLVAVGRGRWSEEQPLAVLESLDPNRSVAPAPAHGLYLVEVKYP